MVGLKRCYFIDRQTGGFGDGLCRNPKLFQLSGYALPCSRLTTCFTSRLASGLTSSLSFSDGRAKPTPLINLSHPFADVFHLKIAFHSREVTYSEHLFQLRTIPSHSEPSFVILNEVKNPTGSILVLFLLPRYHKNSVRQHFSTVFAPEVT